MDGMHLHGGAPSPLTWAPVSFLVMWVVMTAAMMLPSMAPTLWRYREALVGAGETRAFAFTALAGSAYLVVWTALGMIVFLLGIAFDAARTWSPALTRAAPIADGAVVLVAGGIQLTRWKTHKLSRVRASSRADLRAATDAVSAWRYGIRLGRDCGLSCAGPMAGALAVGAMDLGAMAIVTVAITAERVAPAGDRIARVIGLGAIAVGGLLIARAVGPG